MRSRARAAGLVDRLARIGVLPDDSEDERLRKSTLTLSSVLIVTLAWVWVITYLMLGLTIPALIPFAYQLASLTSLVYFARTRRYGFFRASQLLLMLLLPFLLQWSLGGYVASSAVSLWALVSPLAAVMFLGADRAFRWFIAFVALTAVSGALEPYLGGIPGDIPDPLRTLFFVLNITGTTVTTFLVLRYFVQQRDRARVALDGEHRLLILERGKSERLLLNVLPRPIAERLKAGEVIIADAFPEVTVMFADIVGFTPLAEQLPPGQVVTVLNELFTAFDEMADRRGLEKIKTIGDAYMVAGGLPEARADHVEAVADMALAMREEAARHEIDPGRPLSLRIGLDVGPAIAGVIGRRRFIYDLWGDTVNTASRMESHGVPGAVQVTQRVYQRLRGRYRFEQRGPISVKGKGSLTTYLLLPG
jgi:adenylate cyclase